MGTGIGESSRRAARDAWPTPGVGCSPWNLTL